MLKFRTHQERLKARCSQIGTFSGKKLILDWFPGSGKSFAPLIVGKELQDQGLIKKILWVTPRKNLAEQAAEDCLKPDAKELIGHKFSFRESYKQNEFNPFRGHDGLVMSYQCLSGGKNDAGQMTTEIEKIFLKEPCLLVLDEMQHIPINQSTEHKNERGYFNAVKPLYDSAKFVLGMSGSLQRNGDEKIAFLDYHETDLGNKRELRPIVHDRYTYQDGLNEQSLIPIYHTVVETKEISYTKNFDSDICKNSIDNGTDLRVALDTGIGRKIMSVAYRHWMEFRKTDDPYSKLIVVCRNQTESREIKKFLMNTFSAESLLAISDESNSHANIRLFRTDPSHKILVTCAMAYEGMDCKDATHIACLTDYRSDPWIIQMLARSMRVNSKLTYERQSAHVFVPDDADILKILKDLGSKQNLITEEIVRITGSGQIPKQTGPIEITNQTSVAGDFAMHDQNGNTANENLMESVKNFKVQHEIKLPDMEIVKVLQAAGSLQQLAAYHNKPIAIHSAEPLPKTPQQLEKELKQKIQKLLNRMDGMSNSEPGTWNKKAHNYFRYKNRKNMTYEELKGVYNWAIEEFNRNFRQQT